MKLNQDGSGFLIGNKVEVAKINTLLSSIDGKVGMIHKLLVAAKSTKASSTATNRRQKSEDKAPTPKRESKQGKTTQPTPAPTPKRESVRRSRTGAEDSPAPRQRRSSTPKPRPAPTPKTRPVVTPTPAANTEEEPIPQGEGAAEGSVRQRRARRERASAGQGDVTPSPTNPNRDSRGRFIRRTPEGNLSDLEKSKASKVIGTITKGIGDFASKLATGTGDIEEVDPTVKAINEIAQPLSAGYSAIFGENKSGEERWLEKLYKRIKANRDKEKTENRQQQQTLNDILDSNNAGSRGLIGTLSTIGAPIIALLTALAGKMGLSSISGRGSSGSGATGGSPSRDRGTTTTTGGTGGADTGAQGQGRGERGARNPLRAKRFARRLPVVGALFSAGAAAQAVSNIEGGEGTREEKDREVGREVGSLGGIAAGGAAGAAIGTAILPVVGTAIGGALGAWLGDSAGAIIGEQAGTFFNSLRGADIGERIVSQFSSIATSIKDAFSKSADAISDLWNGAVDTVSSGVDGLASNTMLIASSFANTARSAFNSVKSSASNAIDRVTGKKARENKSILEKQMDADGITDPKERAMFLAQMDHESGGFNKMEEGFNYSAGRLMGVSQTARSKGIGAVLAAQKEGAPAVAELMYGGRMGNTAQGDAYKYRGRGYTQLTGKDAYTRASKELGIDLISNPDLAAQPETAAKIATWYWKQSGAQKAAQAGDVSKVGRIINGGDNGAIDRANKTAQYLAQASAPVQSVSQSAITAEAASAAAVAPPNIAQIKPPAPAAIAAKTATIPSVAPIKLSYNQGQQNSTANAFDISRDISDRSIAHIVTGGYAPKP
ncbi:MAG: glycoside hydrolase family 19 protein [Enterovibrio sp.]